LFAAVAGLVIGLAGAAFWMSGPESATTPDDIATVGPERNFSYSILVQQFRDGAPYREPFVLPGEMIFQPEYRIRIRLMTSEAGNIYVLNQGPEGNGALPSYNILFPGSEESAKIVPEQVIPIPGEEDWFVFDEQQGTEQLWLVWSKQPLEVLEATKSYGDAASQGAIDDSSLVQRIHAFLNEQHAVPVRSVRDEAAHKTVVTGAGDVITRLVKLEHR
jgi:hypothetical protein